MPITYHKLAAADYQNQRYDIIKLLEEGGNVSLLPYLDSKKIPTIGIGMNIQGVGDVQNAVFKHMFGVLPAALKTSLVGELAKAQTTEAALRTSLNKILTDWNTTHPADMVKGAFTFANEQEVKDAFVDIAPKFETRVTTQVAGVPESTERLVLFSLEYNGLLAKSPTLKKAIVAGDRDEAWYQIRYVSNGDNLAGIAKRRYYESEKFGLYNDPAKVTDDEAKGVLEMYTTNKKKILAYDKKWDAQLEADYNKGYAQDLDESLHAAKEKLKTSLNLPKHNVDEYEYLVGDKDINGDTEGANEPHNKQDVIIGGDKANALTGGEGNDILFGGKGNDALNGGAGEDTAVFTGKCAEYDFKENADGSWRVTHARGTKADAVDTLKDMEIVKFTDGRFKLESGKNPCAGQDLGFIIDTTGSMFDDIAAVKSAAASIIDAIFSETNDLHNSRVAVVGYKDPGEVSTILKFTDHEDPDARKAAAIAAINSISVGGGGDFPEGVYSGLLHALNGSIGTWREEAEVRRLILFGDAPPKDSHLAATVNALAANVAGGVSVSGFDIEHTERSTLLHLQVTDAEGAPAVIKVEIFTVLVGFDSSAKSAFEQIAGDNSGRFFSAANASEVVKALLEAVTAPPVEPPSSGAIEGTKGDDHIHGTGENDLIHAGHGNDTVDAGDGDDSIKGSNGHDVLNGEEGDDYLSGHFGNDTMGGGEGNDTLIGWTGHDSLYGGEGNDTLAGGVGDDSLRGGEGEDYLTGDTGSDTMDGGEGNDTLKGGNNDDSLYGGEGDDRLYGDVWHDLLSGAAGNDYMRGGTGNDTLIGGEGADKLYGDDGQDVFRYMHTDDSTPDNRDWIVDFKQGEDIIDLHALSFAHLVSGTPTGSALGFHFDGKGNTIIEGMDFELRLSGEIHLQASDFIF